MGWQDVCANFHRAHPDSCAHCIESDTELTAGIAPEEFRLYKCKNNMWDAATPIMIGGQHVGNLFTGQFFFGDEDPPDYDLFRAQARRYGFDEAAYLAALERVPRLTRADVDAGLAFLRKLGQMLSLLSYSNIKLARSVAARERLTDSLSRTQQIAQLGSWERESGKEQLTWSDEVYRMFGLQPGELRATHTGFLDVVHPDDRAAVDAAYAESVRSGRPYEIAHRIVKRDTGEVRWVHEKCEHIQDADGRVVRSIGMVQDITERKRVEEQRRHTQKLESVGLLAGGIAHDFNNLLVGIIGNASLAEDMMPHGSAAVENLRRIVKAGEQAAHLTRQMLAYAGKGRFLFQPVNLPALVRDAYPLLHSAVSRKIALQLRLDPDMAPVMSDPSQMQQVLMNLVVNAGEAIGDNLGSIVVSTGETAVDAEFAAQHLSGWAVEPGPHVFLEVRDSGCGMDGETQARIFDPFYSTKFQGRGLGLAAVAGIVRSHKGGIEVMSAPGAGAAIRVLLPAMALKATRSLPVGVSKEDVRGEGTVLVVDDEEIVRELARRSLERHGYKVLVAENGQAAIDILRENAGRIGVVLLDMSMPGMSGEETLPHLRSLKPDVAVLVSSGYSEAETLRMFQGSRISGFIQKPYTVQQLAKKIKLLMA